MSSWSCVCVCLRMLIAFCLTLSSSYLSCSMMLVSSLREVLLMSSACATLETSVCTCCNSSYTVLICCRQLFKN